VTERFTVTFGPRALPLRVHPHAQTPPPFRLLARRHPAAPPCHPRGADRPRPSPGPRDPRARARVGSGL